MVFAGTNYLAVIVAAIAAFVFGWLYYAILGASHGTANLPANSPKVHPSNIVITFLAKLAMAWIMAGLIGHLGPGQVTLKNGLISAGIVWFGFMLTVTAVNNRRTGSSWKTTFLDAGHWLGVAIILGGIIGGLGV